MNSSVEATTTTTTNTEPLSASDSSPAPATSPTSNGDNEDDDDDDDLVAGCKDEEGSQCKKTERKRFLVALLLSIFVGYFGIDRFYLGHIGTGILKLLTLGCCGVWWLVDVILIAVGGLGDFAGCCLLN